MLPKWLLVLQVLFSGSTAGAGVCAGQKAVTKLQEKGFLPFDLDKKGCIVTDSSLNVPGHEHIFAIGDTAAAVERTSGGGAAETGGPWPPTAQVCSPCGTISQWYLLACPIACQGFMRTHMSSAMSTLGGTCIRVLRLATAA